MKKRDEKKGRGGDERREVEKVKRKTIPLLDITK